MANSKMTKRDWFEVISGIVADSASEQKDGAMEFIAHEVELLNRKSSNTKPTKTQEANIALIAHIGEVLARADKPMTVTELQAFDTELGLYSNQKITALVGRVPNVVRTMEKKKAYYSIEG